MPISPELAAEYPGVAEAFADWTPETIQGLYDGKPDRTDLMVSRRLVDFDTTPSIRKIQDLVSRKAHLDPSAMVAACRTPAVARARMVAMALCVKYTPESMVRIGRAFGGRNSTTVLHAKNRVPDLRESDPHVEALWSKCEQELGFDG